MLQVRDLRVTFHTASGPVRAVNGISFGLERGEILALVGESGSGKSVSSLSLVGLLPENAEVTGEVWLGGEQVLHAPKQILRGLRQDAVAYVFQDPISSLNPARRVGSQLQELLRVNRGMDHGQARERAVELLAHVGIAGRRYLRSYPHELSGGMCQRVMIAMALAAEPEIIVADEATSSLDVSIQAQILELLQRVRDDFETAMIMVTHDFGVVAGIADRVAVMYGGEIVEVGKTSQVLSDPQHPYTAALMMSAPDAAEGRDDDLFMIPGTLDEGREFAGSRCQFAPRCPLVFDRCWTDWPELSDREMGTRAACHLEEGVVTQWRESGAAAPERT